MTNESGEALARHVLEVLAGRGESLATAESLTGGLLSATLTDVPGASRSFAGAIVSYATRIKESLLGVPVEVVAGHGVVSGECAQAMALGARARLRTTSARPSPVGIRSRSSTSPPAVVKVVSSMAVPST